MPFRIRLLPIAIALAFVMLSVKSYDLGKGLTVVPSNIEFASVRAQGQPPLLVPPGERPQLAQAATSQGGAAQQRPAPGGAQPAAGAQRTAAAQGQQPPAAGRPDQKRSAFLASQDEWSEQELAVLQKLADRREELEKREREIQSKGITLQAAEKRLTEKVQELQALQATIASLVSTHSDQEKKRLDSLVKIYENMKPRDAAKIFEELDMLVMLDVIELMKERKVAPILANMNPNRAKEVTVELANRRQLPVPKE
ncbi:MAG: hypothetical protein JNK11_17035 [Alphaproteobacteria bacterium]|nr:hypothetical protein [Alphaproteobacteria bacterium]